MHAQLVKNNLVFEADVLGLADRLSSEGKPQAAIDVLSHITREQGPGPSLSF